MQKHSKTFKNIRKRLKIYKKSDETFENIQKYSTILEKFRRCPVAVAQLVTAALNARHREKIGHKKASAFAEASADKRWGIWVEWGK